jgi:hypothetical protein
MGKNKNKNHGPEENKNQEQKQEITAEQQDSNNTPETEGENDMNLKKVRRNVLQVIGDAARNLGDKAADFKANHKVADTAIKVVGGVAVAGAVIGAAAIKILGDKDEEIVDAEDNDVEVPRIETEDTDEYVDDSSDVEDLDDETEEGSTETEEVEA